MKRERSCRRKRSKLRTLLFRRTKYPVPEDLWSPAAFQRGEKLHVEAVVSEMYVLKQIKEVIEFREHWLRENDLPMNFQTRDGMERKEFLKWAKDHYQAEDRQQKLQEEDLKEGG